MNLLNCYIVITISAYHTTLVITLFELDTASKSQDKEVYFHFRTPAAPTNQQGLLLWHQPQVSAAWERLANQSATKGQEGCNGS